MRYRVDINNNLEIYDVDKVAKQASGAVLLQIKNAVVLATVAREDEKVREIFYL